MKWKNIPTDWGYYWVKKPDNTINMMRLYPSKYYKENKQVEVWSCPGIERYYLDSNNMPKWKWCFVKHPLE